jgi:hypothetical protein
MPANILERVYQSLGLIGDQTPRDLAMPPQRNPPSPLPTFIDFIRSRLSLLNQPPKADEISDAFVQRLEPVLETLDGQMRSYAWFTLVAGKQEWLDTGIDMAAGEWVTVMGDGRLYLSRPLDVAIGPSFGLWYRIVNRDGAGHINKLPTGGAAISAEQDGRLHLITAVPGEFGDPQGGFDSSIAKLPTSGQFSVVVLRWLTNIENALTAAAAADVDLFGPILARFKNPVRAPKGWHYLWRLGASEIYKADDDGLCCTTHADGGILQYPLDMPLSSDLVFNWQWCVDALPSKLAEHIQPTHDYLSIAIEFDNGLDLTYMWSSTLDVDTIFQCPLPWWDKRETHWVLRNDSADLGRWLSESRNIQADYLRAIGGPLPEKVVGVWLIANSAFQRGEGHCRYRQIALKSDSSIESIHK